MKVLDFISYRDCRDSSRS